MNHWSPLWRIAIGLLALAALLALKPLSWCIDRLLAARAAVPATEATRLALMRKQPPETTAGAGARLTLLPPVEPTRKDVR